MSLTHYSGAGAQPLHAHDFAQLSFLLAGSMAETLENEEHRPEGLSIGCKPAGSLHSNRWGPDGALIFSITFAGGAGRLAETLAAPGWRALRRDLPIAEIVRACFEADEGRRREAIDELAALLPARSPPAPAAPKWLRQARDALTECEGIGVDEVARSVGVDRSHLARLFHACYGLPPSIYRRRVQAARAVAAVARGGEPLARIAHEAGFSDHAHMSRTLKSDTGLGPASLRRLLKSEITSVQDHYRAGR